METKTTVTITSATKGLKFGVWDIKEEKFVSLHEMNPEETAQMAERLGCSTALIDALVMFAESIAYEVNSDLVDIWKRLDKIETAVKSL